MKRRDLIRHLELHGCVFVREGGNHTLYKNHATNRSVPVPRHREISDHLARSICHDLGVAMP